MTAVTCAATRVAFLLVLLLPAAGLAAEKGARTERAHSASRAEAKLLRVAPGDRVEVRLDPRSHGAVAAIRVLSEDRRGGAPRALEGSVTLDRSRTPILRIAAGKDAAPGGPYVLEGVTRDGRRVPLPYRVEVVAGAGKAAPAARRASPARRTTAPVADARRAEARRAERPAAAEAPSARSEHAAERRRDRSVPTRGRPVPRATSRELADRSPALATPPSGRALLILLENGGLRSSLSAIGSELPDLPEVPYLAYPKGALPEDQVHFLMRKNESIAQAVARVSDEIEALSADEGSDLFQQAYRGACNLLPTSAMRLVTGSCNPRADCLDLTPGNPACQALPTNAPCPESESYNPRQECLASPPDTPALRSAMLDPANWTQHSVPFEEWLDISSDFLIEEIAKVARHQSAFLGRYDEVVVLEDAQVKPAIAIETIQELSSEHVVDVHVLTHGTTNRIIGVEQGGTRHDFTESTFFGPLREAKEAGEPVWIRAVYQMNCNSGTLTDEWESLGAVTVAGTRHGPVSNYMPQQYIPFVNHWLANETFERATDRAYEEARFVSEEFYEVISSEPELMEHSELDVAGAAATRVSQ